MPKQVQVVSDVEVDEISLVDRPACQNAAVVLAKRATQEESVPDNYFTEAGAPVEVDALTVGDIVYDADGGAYRIELEDAPADERELATVGKSAFLEQSTVEVDAVSKSLAESLQAELSKALADSDQAGQAEVLSKALEEISKAEQRAAQAERIAKAERDLRLQREYIAKAAEYHVPIAAQELGPVLMRMAESMSYEDCSVINKALTSSGAQLRELGLAGSADNLDPMAQLDAVLDGQIEKAADGVSKAAQVSGFFDNNPGAYDEYRRELGLGR